MVQSPQNKKHINWILGHTCDHWIWPWPWPWPWIFKVKYGICYILAKSGPTGTKWKANISIELKSSTLSIGFDLEHDLEQSGTKPNLVAKIWPPNLVTIYAWLPKLVANVSSNFHHLVNAGAGLAVFFFFQMATNNGSPHMQFRHNLSGLYLADWKWLHPIIITFNTLCLVKFYIQWCGALQWTHWCSYLKQLICSCLAS